MFNFELSLFLYKLLKIYKNLIINVLFINIILNLSVKRSSVIDIEICKLFIANDN